MQLYEKPIIIYVDKEINRVFRNLIENAIHPTIMPNGGKLTIATRVVGGMAEAQVEDTGIGIPKENIYDILQPWYTTKPGKGHGLGLWWTQNYIQVFGGEVELESEVGKGTRVIIRLPISNEDSENTSEDLLGR
jgi:signal transduction histidine kinase